ncbi:T9SS type A sorting domain-containing protein [Flavobacterium sp.]
MKYFLLSSLFLLVTVFSAKGQTTKRVLFIGNSYTSVNNLPSMISNMAVSTGDLLSYDANLPGGSRFMNHASNATTLSKINSDVWDYVVLQAQSQETSLSEVQMSNEVYPYAVSLSNAIRANNQCSQPMFYMTWGRESGDSSNCNFMPWVCTYEAMDDVIRATYVSMSQSNHAELAPVGAVWRYLRTNYPTIDLYSSDSSHPSIAGSYAAACVFYTMIYKKDPTFISWNSLLSDSEATILKLAVKTIVFDQINSWDYTVNPAMSNFTEVIQGGEVSFTNTSAAFDSLVWSFGDGNESEEINPFHEYNASGNYTITLTTIKCGKSNTVAKTIEINTNLNTNIFDQQKNFTIYPNPCSNHFTVSLDKNHNNISVILFDVLGKVIQKKECQHVSVIDIDTVALSNGIYIVQIIADGEFYTSKITKQ